VPAGEAADHRGGSGSQRGEKNPAAFETGGGPAAHFAGAPAKPHLRGTLKARHVDPGPTAPASMLSPEVHCPVPIEVKIAFPLALSLTLNRRP